MLRVACAALAVSLWAATAGAQTILTFEDVIARARAQAGAVAVARARIPEAEAGLLDAAARFRENPAIDASIGPRTGSGTRFTDLDVGFSQLFETGGQRRARVAGAEAAIDRERADLERAGHLAAGEAARAFLEGVAAGERLRAVEETAAVSRDLLDVAERRYAAGDIAAIDLNLSRIDAARSAAVLGAAQADLDAAVAALRALLGLPEGDAIELRGSLDDAAPLALAPLEARLLERPEFRALAADVRAAEAQADLGRALTRPDVAVRVGYEREEGDTIVLGGVTVTLPMFQKGQGVAAGGLARANRLRLELETSRRRALAELRGTYAVYVRRAQVAATLAKAAAPSLDDNEDLARRSYEAGEMNLLELLTIRREAIATRMEIIDRRLDAALSRLAAVSAAGALP